MKRQIFWLYSRGNFRGSANNDLTDFETSKIRNPRFQLISYYSYLVQISIVKVHPAYILGINQLNQSPCPEPQDSGNHTLQQGVFQSPIKMGNIAIIQPWAWLTYGMEWYKHLNKVFWWIELYGPFLEFSLKHPFKRINRQSMTGSLKIPKITLYHNPKFDANNICFHSMLVFVNKNDIRLGNS